MRPALLVALALAGCAGSTPSPDTGPTALRVMSFNLRVNVASDGSNAWPYRVDAVEGILRDADVVGVQEAVPDMLADLDARLDGWARIGVGRQADGGGEFSAILYRTGRLDVLDAGTFWLSETPNVPGSKSWDAAIERIVTWGRFRDRRSGDTLAVVNTHFDHVGQTARENSARLLTERLDELADGGPVVVMGDFNVTPDNPVYAVLTEGTGLEDARLASSTPPEGVAATWNGFGRDPLERRIDFLFVRGLEVERFATRDETIAGELGAATARYPSDHFAVEATVVKMEEASNRR